MYFRKWRTRLTAFVLAVLFGFMMIQPARTMEIPPGETSADTSVSTKPADTVETIAEDTEFVTQPVSDATGPTGSMTEPVPSESSGETHVATEPVPTETRPVPAEPLPSETQSKPTEPLPSETRPVSAETLPYETQAVSTEPIPSETLALEIPPEELPPDGTNPTYDASEQPGDLSAVAGQGITFRLFNYSTKINKSAGNTAWRPISSYFTFRNSLMEAGTDPTSADIPSPNCNTEHDQDGFTKHHATVEPVLTNGFPVLDLTRNADGSDRTDPSVSSSVRSLAYLFSGGDHAVDAYSPRNTILQRSGSRYFYNSASHAVDYDAEANLFRLRSYAERNSTTADYGSTYGDFLPFTYTGGIEIGSNEDGIGYHVQNTDTDYWFGMSMTVNFFQTKGGKLGDDNMIFRFSGDDDVWVFVDDVLVLDLGGTHGTVDGAINFATGEVRQYLSWGGANATTEQQTQGSSTSFPTTIRERFDAAGRTPRGGWSKDGQTFADFTEHTLKFFYLERGSAVANCMLDFRLPTLPDESLTVTKDLTADSDESVRDFIADTMPYRFRVMKVDEAGNGTDEYFITAGMTYDLLERGSKIGTGTVDSNGYFELKSGQSAQFTQMLRKGNGATSYVVEEIMPENLTGQYAGVEYLVSGAGGETVTEDMEAEGFTAFLTGVLSAEQTQTVTFRNRVDTSKLCRLQVTKLAADGSQIPAEAAFPVEVKLDGIALPVGTPYTVGSEQRTVESAGILLLRVGETARLEQGILSGTYCEITEPGVSQAGYRPSYEGTVLPSGNLEIDADGIRGVFPLDGEIHATVINADYDFAVRIPVYKQVLAFQKQDTFRFSVQQVELLEGKWCAVEALPSEQITVTDGQTVKKEITIGYDGGTEGVFYYRIAEENDGGDYIYDGNFYIVEVTAAADEAQVTAILPNGESLSDAVVFRNRAATKLTVSKTLAGITGAMEFPFTVQVFLDGVPFPMPESTGYITEGNEIHFSLGHGASKVISSIPVGATVVITEQNHEGFTVFTRSGEQAQETPGSSIELYVPGEGTAVEFINRSGYRLPNTGGGAEDVYSAGITVLWCSFGLAALYFYHHGRKEDSASS